MACVGESAGTGVFVIRWVSGGFFLHTLVHWSTLNWVNGTNKECASNDTLVQNNQHNYFDGTFCSSWVIIMIQTYMYTPASCSERVQLAKWTKHVRADLFSLSLLNKRQIAFTTGCMSFFLNLPLSCINGAYSRSRQDMRERCHPQPL